jgi:hypothetical protein
MENHMINAYKVFNFACWVFSAFLSFIFLALAINGNLAYSLPDEPFVFGKKTSFIFLTSFFFGLSVLSAYYLYKKELIEQALSDTADMDS